MYKQRERVRDTRPSEISTHGGSVGGAQILCSAPTRGLQGVAGASEASPPEGGKARDEGSRRNEKRGK